MSHYVLPNIFFFFLFYFVSLAFYPKQKTKWLARGCKSICLRLLSAVNFYREM